MRSRRKAGQLKTVDRVRKRRTIISVSLASVAVLGVGAALTTAAWTDDVWFSAEADTGTVEMYGVVGDAAPALAPGNWSEADDQAASIAIAPTEFAGLVPGEKRAVSIWLWNGSTVPLSVTLPSLNLTGDPLFDPLVTPAVVPASIGVFTDAAGTTPYTTTTITAGDTLQLYVVVNTPEWTGADGQGLTSNTVYIPFSGSTDLP